MPLNIPDQSIAASIKPPDTLNTLSSIMQYKNAQQNLQTNQLDYQIKNVANQKLNQLRDIAADPANRNADGSYNQQKSSDTAASLGPDSQPYQSNALALQSKGIANQSAQLGLTNDQNDIASRNISALLGDPSFKNLADPAIQNDPSKLYAAQAGAKAAFHQMAGQMVAGGLDPKMVNDRMGVLLNEVDSSPGTLLQHIANVAQSRLPGGGQVAQNMIPASGLQTPGSDSQNNPTITTRNQFGGGMTVSGAPVQGAAGTSITQPNILPQGETKESQAQLMQARSATITAAGQVPNTHTYNQNVIRITSDPAFLNPNTWAAKGASYATKLGLPAGTDYQTALDMVGHNLAMATQSNESAMGVSTDAGRNTAGLATGSLKMTPAALGSAAKMNDATASGLDSFNRGQEAAIKGAGNSVFASRDFKNEWSKVYSPVVMQIYNAKKSGDTNEINSIISSTGYSGDPTKFASSPQGQELIRRAKVMESLSKTGHP
jgi:hypothetical protein